MNFRDQATIAFLATCNPGTALLQAQALADDACARWGHDANYFYADDEGGKLGSDCLRCGMRCGTVILPATPAAAPELAPAPIPPIEGMTGAEELRACVGLLNNCNETALDPFTAAELVQIWRAYRLSGWDFAPDEWTPEQREDAARRGIVPQWYSKTELPAPGCDWRGLATPAAPATGGA